jgi:hypothetical protein
MCWRSTLVVTAVSLCFASAAYAQTKRVAKPSAQAAKVLAAPAMSNADVIKMVQSGLGEFLILTTIRQAEKRAFALTPDGLVELKAAGVSDNIIRVMLDPKAAISEAAAPSPVPVVVAEARRPAAVTVKILDGATIKVSVLDEMTSATARINDAVRLEVAEDVKVGEVVVIPKGSTATGRVHSAKPKSRGAQDGALEFSVDYAKAVDGSNVRLRATSGTAETLAVKGKMFIPGGVFMKGKDIVIPKGTIVNALVDGDKEVVKQ